MNIWTKINISKTTRTIKEEDGKLVDQKVLYRVGLR